MDGRNNQWTKTRTVAGYLAGAALAVSAWAEGQSQLVILGGAHVNVGQAGFCGERTVVPPEARKRVFVDGDTQTWVRFYWASASRLVQGPPVACETDVTFTPRAGHAYILRMIQVGAVANTSCDFELFRVVPGGVPVREPLVVERERGCLFEE